LAASVDPTEARNVAGSGPVLSDPGHQKPSRDRATAGRSRAFTADGPGDPIGGHSEADRPVRRGSWGEMRYVPVFSPGEPLPFGKHLEEVVLFDHLRPVWNGKHERIIIFRA